MAQLLPSQILSDIPTFSGKGSCVEWLESFNDRCAHFNYDDLWKLSNLDKFLSGPAKDWWIFSKLRFTYNLTRHNSVNRFVGFTEAIKADFPEVDTKKQATKENAAIKFKSGDHPREYVFKKRALFARIDPNMPQSQQLEYLYEGLPTELRWAVKRQLGAEGTVQKFLSELQCFADDWVKHSGAPSASTSVTLNNSQTCSELYKFPASNNANVSSQPSVSAPVIASTPSLVTSQPVPLPQLPVNPLADVANSMSPMVPICQYCGQSGHLVMGCDLLRRDYVPRTSNNFDGTNTDHHNSHYDSNKSHSGKADSSRSYRQHNNNKSYNRPSDRTQGNNRSHNNSSGNGKA